MRKYSHFFILLSIVLPQLLFAQDVQEVNNQEEIATAIAHFHTFNYQEGQQALSDLLVLSAQQKRNYSPLQLAEIYCYRAECSFEIGDRKASRKDFEAAEKAFNDHPASTTAPGFAYRIYQGLAATAASFEEYLQYNAQMIALVEKIDEQDPKAPRAKSSVEYFLGTEAMYAGKFSEAIDHYKKSAELLDHLEQDIDLASTYNGLAQTYFWAGDYTKATFYNEQDLNVSPPNRPRAYFRTLTNLVGNYVDLRKIEDARKKLVEIRQHAAQYQLEDSDRWPFYFAAKIELHNTMLELDSMKATIDEQLAFYEKYPNYKTEESYAKFLNQYAGWHIRREEYEQAAPLITQSIAASSGENENEHLLPAQFLQTKILCGRKEFEPAIKALHGLICKTNNRITNVCHEERPHQVYLTKQLNASFLTIEYIKDKASYYKYWYDASPKDTLLQLSNANIAIADSLLALTKQSGIYPGLERTVDELSLELRKIQMANIYAANDKGSDIEQVEAALNASERIKQLSISERLHEKLLELDFGLSANVIERERYYINAIERLLNEVRIAPDSTTRQTLKDNLDELSEKQQLHRDMIKANYPAYYDLLYDPPPLTIAEVRENIIGPGEAMIHFAARNDHVYVVAISKKKARLEKLPLSSPLEPTITALVKGLRQQKKMVFPLLRQLYKELLVPVEDIIGDHDLVIVPDDHLWYLPFAALITKDDDQLSLNTERSYLIKERNTRYLISARLAHFQAIKQAEDPESVSGILGMSPLASQSIGAFDSLPGSLATLQLLEQLSSTRHDRYFKNVRATKSAFSRFAPHAALLHIGTHAFIDDRQPENSFLLFQAREDAALQQLTATEIYNLELPAHLAVLSACSTAQGSLRRGQGVANLARAFAHAGCRNMIVNLWEIKDAASEEIMQNFYPALIQNNEPAATAFNAAQLAFIENSGMNAHPGFWATSIYLGNNERVPLNNRTNPLFFILAVCAGVVLAAFGLYRSTQMGK